MGGLLVVDLMFLEEKCRPQLRDPSCNDENPCPTNEFPLENVLETPASELSAEHLRLRSLRRRAEDVAQGRGEVRRWMGGGRGRE